MKISEMFPSTYARGEDLPEKGVKVIITGVKRELFHGPGGESDGFILWCADAKKGIILTAALARGIAQALNESDTDNWIGKAVILYPVRMTVAGRDVTAIRARAVNNG